MATLEKKLHEEVRRRERSLSGDADYKRLQDYYFEMKKLGVSKKQEYNLPQIDTVGISYYHFDNAQ